MHQKEITEECNLVIVYRVNETIHILYQNILVLVFDSIVMFTLKTFDLIDLYNSCSFVLQLTLAVRVIGIFLI